MARRSLPRTSCSASSARAPSHPSLGCFADISDVRALDAPQARISTRGPDALLPDPLRLLFIMSKAWAEEHGVTRAADFKAGQETYATRQANGTGPFILDAFEPGGRVVMSRNPHWWGDERYPVNIDRIEFTPIAAPRGAPRGAVEREVGLLTSPPFDALDRIEATPGWKLVQTTQLRSVWLGRQPGKSDIALVRYSRHQPVQGRARAPSHVSRDRYRGDPRQVMQGRSIPAGMIIPPGVNGHALSSSSGYPTIPRAARALLAEAGYPKGSASRSTARTTTMSTTKRSAARQLGS